ncbi:MAG TPA: hypothetical protein VE821_15620, partial [Pyrinomonadaceae bacterium]|nr:hypothetical protein [Pyrinomonadaceae bacterium]
PNFAAALAGLFGEGANAQPSKEQAPEAAKQNAQPSAPPPNAGAPPDVQQLIDRANQEFNDYQRLTSEGKLGEAGQKLDELKRTLTELQKASGKSQ